MPRFERKPARPLEGAVKPSSSLLGQSLTPLVTRRVRQSGGGRDERLI